MDTEILKALSSYVKGSLSISPSVPPSISPSVLSSISSSKSLSISSSAPSNNRKKKLIRGLIKQIETETGHSFSKFAKKNANEKARLLEEERTRYKQERKRKKKKISLLKISLLSPKPRRIEVCSVISSKAIEMPEVENPPVLEFLDLALNVAYCRSPIKDHPQALDYALVAISLAGKSPLRPSILSNDSLPRQGMSMAMSVAYQNIFERLELAKYIDSPDCYYQEETRLLTTIRQALMKMGVITCANKQVAITESGLDRIRLIMENLAPAFFCSQLQPTPSNQPTSSNQPIPPKQPTTPTPPIPPTPLLRHKNAELLQIAKEELETLQHTSMGIEASLAMAKSKVVAAQSDYDKIFRRKTECERKMHVIQNEIKELL